MSSGQQMLIDLESQTKHFVALQGTYLSPPTMQQQLSAKNCTQHTTDPNTGHKAKNCRNKEQKNQSSSSEGCSVPQQLLNQTARTESIL